MELIDKTYLDDEVLNASLNGLQVLNTSLNSPTGSYLTCGISDAFDTSSSQIQLYSLM